jgi:anti-sigma regulatory factor (Ser/Thr protein kinase)
MSEESKVSRTFAGELDQIHAVYEFISETVRRMALPADGIPTLEMVTDEIFNNIVTYAYRDGDGGDKWVTVEIASEDGTIRMTFIDEGAPFDPSSAPSPDISLSSDTREFGGLGIHIVRSVTDSMTYSRENGRNVLTVRKKL